jgi:hypothetical protein
MPKVKPPRITTDSTGARVEVIIPPRVQTKRPRGQLAELRRHEREARADLAQVYFADLYQAWKAKGEAVLETCAMLYPDTFLRVVASHMPREMHATVTKINVSRLSNAELDALIEQEIRAAAGEEETQDDPAFVQ